ncbi:MAG TPA: cob(I)yrinic acid a,c-diamide adenosyltransferase [Chloroflexi bacterium]|nr:cob(I)yrinic acid a,c-diamide adenosyltransferase [Chloroflexota bacterium]
MTPREGLVQVYTGDGQGVTLSAAGQALRSVGQGFRVCVIQFIQGCTESRGLNTALADQPNITVRRFGRSTGLAPEAVEAGDLKGAQAALAAAGAAVATDEYDLVILDQAILALHWKLIELPDLLSLLRRKHKSVELILTGCCAPPELIAVADLVTEMVQSKGSPQWGAAVC